MSQSNNFCSRPLKQSIYDIPQLERFQKNETQVGFVKGRHSLLLVSTWGYVFRILNSSECCANTLQCLGLTTQLPMATWKLCGSPAILTERQRYYDRCHFAQKNAPKMH